MGLLNKKTEITISNRTIFRVVVVLGLAVFSARFFLALTKPLTLVLIAFFLAMALNPAVSWVSKHLKRQNRTLATAISFISVILVLVTFFSFVIPPLVSQVADFVTEVPASVQNLKSQDSPVGRAIQRYDLDQQIDEFSSNFESMVEPEPILNTGRKIGEVIVSTFAVLAMTFMMLNEGPAWVKRILSLVPSKQRKHREMLLGKMYRMVTGYVNGQLIVSTIAATLLLVVLLIVSSLLDVTVNAVALAGIMAIFGLIPMIGNPIGAVIVVGACLLSSFNLAVIVGVYFLIYSQIENVTLQPYVQSKQNELTPLTVFISALIGISYGGIVGALFAIPVAGCIRIFLIDWIDRKGYPLSSGEEVAPS